MSTYYDPWLHAVNLFINRLILFVLLTLLIGLGGWAGLLHWLAGADSVAIARSTLVVVTDAQTDRRWRVILALCGAVGALLALCLFIWLRGRARLRRGDRHHRGTRVVVAVHDDE